MNKVAVHNGSFSTQADFGPLAKSFSQAFVSTSVRSPGQGEFVSLDTRAQVSVSPASSVCPGAWTLDGNAGNPAGSYLGTADTKPLTFEVNGTQVGQITVSGNATIAPSAANVVFGSPTNNVGGGLGGATIAGGGDAGTNCGSGTQPCGNSVTQYWATVGGGRANVASGTTSTVAGGYGNAASGNESTVAGGYENQAAGRVSTVGGGGGDSAIGDRSTVAGGSANVASGFAATIPGGFGNTAGGDYSFAGGYGAVARAASATVTPGCTAGTNCGDYGTFVWEDASNQGTNFTSTGPNQFLIQANGGVAINGTPVANTDELTVYGNGNGNNNVNLHLLPFGATQGFNVRAMGGGSIVPSFQITQDGAITATRFDIGSTGNIGLLGAGTGTNPLTVGTDTTNGNGAFLSAGGVWTAGSSRTFKEDFARIDASSILAKVIELPVQTWFYKNDHQEGRHMGPVAEDFAALFGLGNDDKHIGGVDESGVAFAAIQGLNQKVEAEKVENADLKEKSDTLARENAELRSKLDDLTARMSRLEAKQGQ
ncbi:MAG: hypothetical protein P4L92_04110 [Rudaea sp.]|nr:hypothetical protein [Rudaea sp.]